MTNVFKHLAQGIAQSFLGTAMLVYVEDIRHYIAAAPSWPLDQDRAEVRLQATFITVVYLLLLAEPIFYLYWVPDSLISGVSALGTPRWCIVGSFGVAFIGALPHLYTLIFRPDLLDHKIYRKAAAFAAVVAGATWIVLANRAVHLDVGGLEWAYAIRAVAVFFIAGIFGVSVNAQQLRENFNAASR